MKAARELLYEVKPMPKFVDFEKCRGCGMRVSGCPYDAKWPARAFPEEACETGAKLLTETIVERVLRSDGEVEGGTC
ncbi:hypothetical protein DRO57_04485 [Candidatus Bathyarchaeota archaeon]|nr:MAG: hypothetical protein DRO57_04485 [Candidatus Bathyarchaeota archaeon]